MPVLGIGDDALILVTTDAPTGDGHGRAEGAATIDGSRDVHRRVAALPRELRPSDVDRAVAGDVNRIVVGKLARRSPGLAVALETPIPTRTAGRATPLGQVRPPSVDRLSEERHPVWGERLVAEASEVRSAVRPEGDGRIATVIVHARAGHLRIIGVSRDAGEEAVRQRRRPRLAAVEGRIHATAVVVVPVVAPRDQVVRVPRVHRQRRLVLRRRVAADVHDQRGPSAATAAEARRCRRDRTGIGDAVARARAKGGDEHHQGASA